MNDTNRDPPLRICKLSYYFPPEYSGSAKQALNVAKYLRQQGVESIFVAARLRDVPKADRIEGFPVYRLPVSQSAALAIPSFWLRLTLFLIRNRKAYDLIHAHGTIQHSIAGLVGRLLGKPTLLKIAMANSDIAFESQGRLWGRLQKLFVSYFDRYIATSEQIVDELLQANISANGRILRIPNGVDVNSFSQLQDAASRRQLREELGLSQVPVLLYVGIISARKNVELIVKAWRRARDAGSVGQLVCVGPIPNKETADWSYYTNLLSYVADHDLEDTVAFVGYQQDPATYYRAAEAFLFPSFAEGMPNAVLEALASGLPCLVGKFSGAREMIQDGREGWIVSSENVGAYAERIIQLLRDAGLRSRMSAAARERAVRDFSLETTAASLKETYLGLLESTRSTTSSRHPQKGQ